MKSPKFIFIPDAEMRCILIHGDQRCGLISVGRWIKVLVLCGNDSIWCRKKVYFYLLRLWNLTKKTKQSDSVKMLNLISIRELGTLDKNSRQWLQTRCDGLFNLCPDIAHESLFDSLLLRCHVFWRS